MSIKNRTAVVGVGHTRIYKRGTSAPRTMEDLLGEAIIAAVADAGLDIADVNGFAYYAGGFDTPMLTEILGIPEVRFSASLTGSGGGSAGALGLAATAIVAGQADVVVCVGGLQQAKQRYGTYALAREANPETAFYHSAGLVGPGHMFALLARRHMHRFGTTREHFAEVAISHRANAVNHPLASQRKPLTTEDYFAAPMLADPHCLYDFCLENDGAIAVVVTSAERARDLRHVPARIVSSVHGGSRTWGRSLYWMNMPDDEFVSSGNVPIARRLYEAADLTPGDIDVAQIYDHFTSQVIMQLEDFGFCERGEGGPFVESGAIRFDGGSIPTNTDGGQLSGGYIWGMTHVLEAVHQVRGTAVNQVPDVRNVLVTGGPSSLPNSALILGR
ncbi:thiolase C-terminal domain-containing protein [Phytohabitans kaempferiae]|uniref:Thiolase n=1 Tax=Phytohabitans kaempferiae TaxID=1620943 RepID=A0ABV6M510_9ACTN